MTCGRYVKSGWGKDEADFSKEAKTFRDWGKIQFATYQRKDWTEVLPDASDVGRQLVDGLVRYQSTERLSATEVCYGLV